MTGKREESRARTTAQILSAARHEIAERGGQGLSMRAVAREVGLVSSAVYRYFPTREALLTAMIVESYHHLADALATVDEGAPAERWGALVREWRAWAKHRPHEFQLVYGTPIPGYVAPPETIPAAAAVAAPFFRCGATERVVEFEGVHVGDALTSAYPDLTPSGIAAVLAELATVAGTIGLELSGHFVGTTGSPDALVEAVIARQVHTLGLA
ncbi:TetR/AcrR family transcriptional regulator [Pseudoclavibacter chungangensis]|uniref:TetR/AcrR family transcriptional regulator n=1 Tax=Pseudoclavibacter chungangensis TaxID=587635 RepID=A0A7J5C175_9MICO|nr:TetR/AcrR family transcriptional regulator [Pseudoclavibacter chungangensis]KAB1662381.1 TetR/AcrR family transcriptional regulator [Pseudoclavibacter chungangensis]NYJ68402.1 AcrR family transcriptional regulator [Pseudoclavibacter chungangensis]